MKKIKLFAMALAGICCLGLIGCGKADIPEPTGEESVEDQLEAPQKGDTIAIFHFEDYDDVTVRLFKKGAPKAVENFVTHAKQGYYDGTIFHRVIDDFMIQGGDPTGTGMGGESIWNQEFEDEIVDNLLPIRGALCMANRGANTNGSQFFIVQAKASNLNSVNSNALTDKQRKMFEDNGGTPHLIGAHTVFGQVTDGMDVIDEIAGTSTDANDKPLKEVKISSIEIKESK